MSDQITVDYEIAEEELDPQDVAGGIQVSIDGDRINQYQDENSYEPLLDWEPQYVGEYLHADFNRLVDRTKQIAMGNIKIYDCVMVRFDPNTVYLLLEPVGPEAIRVAYRNQLSDDLPIVAPESACGYVVDRCEFCRTVSEAAHDYVADLRSMPLEWGIDVLDEFEDTVDELDATLAGCE